MCSQSPTSSFNSDDCLEFEIELDQTATENETGRGNASNATNHDPNEVNCPASMPTARLIDVRMQLDFRDCRQDENMSTAPQPASLTAMVDAALRDLISHSPPRLAAGIRRCFPYGNNLQDTFPAIFCPGRSKAVLDRLRLISSITQSLTTCKREPKEQRSNVGPTDSSFIEAEQEKTRNQELGGHPIATIEDSLFMSLVHNTRNTKGGKALKSLTTEAMRKNGSVQLNELPDINEHLSLFDRLIEASDASPISLFFGDFDGSEREGKAASCPGSPKRSPEDAVEVTDESPQRIRATPSFEELIFTPPADGTFLEHCNPGNALASRRCSEAASDIMRLSRFADQQPIWELESDMLMLREPLVLIEEAEAHFSSHSSANLDVIGEAGKLTQSSIRRSPPDDYAPMKYLEGELHALTTSDAQQGDKGNIDSFPEDFFAFDLQQSSFGRPPARLDFINEPLELLDDHRSTTSSSDDLELICWSQQSETPMTSSGDLSLAELLEGDKFSREMWNRRRSTVMDSIPTTYSPRSTTRSLGAGWSLKSPPSEIKQTPTRPTTGRSRDNGRSPSDDDNRRIFSKRSSVSSASSASQSPTEEKSHRRGNLLRRLSRSSKSSSDQEMLDLDLSRIDQRAVEVKRRKTIEDYDMGDAREEDDDMLFA